MENDDTYITKRNMLIPRAKKIADQQCGAEAPEVCSDYKRDKWNAEWSKTLMQTMDKLAFEAGLRGTNKGAVLWMESVTTA